MVRTITNIRGMVDPAGESRRRADLAWLAWAERGGIDEVDQSYKWKRSMRARYAALVEIYGDPPRSMGEETAQSA